MTTFIPGPSAPEKINGTVVDSELAEAFVLPLDAPDIPEQREALTEPTTAPPVEKVKGGELRPILASWVKDREEFTGTVKAAGKRAGHTTLWHLVPWHLVPNLLRVLKCAVVGFWRDVAAVWGWVFAAESKPLRREAVNANEASEWRALHKEYKEAVTRRWRGLLAVVVLAVVALALLWWLLPSWTITPWLVLTPGWDFVLAGGALVTRWIHRGRPRDKAMIVRATDTGGNAPLRPELICAALCSLGVAKMNVPDEIRVLSDLTREGSAGSSVELELPMGVPAKSVMEKRSELSAGLRREIGTVWPAVGKRHEGHLILYVSDESMATAKQKRWPLLRDGTVDVFKPAPAFTDQRGRWVELTLAYTCGVIGAVPRMGKSFALRELLLLGALDPRVKEYVYDLKGTGDHSPLKLVAHRYGVGDEPEDIAEQLADMRELRQELRRRVKVIRSLPDEDCPDRKVTTELASDRKLGLEPILVGVDECQVWFENEDKAVAAEFTAICTDLVKRGPAVGIMIYLATQKPDAKAIPTSIADNAIVRLCFMVFGWRSNDQVLGTGAHERGIRATMFAFEDKGIAYYKGEGPETQIVRTVVGLDAVAAGKVAARAYALRKREGRLSGFAAGEAIEHEVEEVVLLDDVRTVVGAAETMHLGDIVTGLSALRPAAWGALGARSLGAQLRTAGVRTDTVYVADKPRSRANGTGVRREWLDVDTTLQVGNEDPGEASFRTAAEGESAD